MSVPSELTFGSSNVASLGRARTVGSTVTLPAEGSQQANNSPWSGESSQIPFGSGMSKGIPISELRRAEWYYSNRDSDADATIVPQGDKSSSLQAEAVVSAKAARVRERVSEDKQPITEVLERWYGVVTEIGKEKFRARVSSTALRHEEEADFPRSAVSEIDADLFEIGAQFVFVIGQETRLGMKTTFSRLLFRRMPTWQEREIITAKEWGKEIASFLKRKASARNDEPKQSSQRE